MIHLLKAYLNTTKGVDILNATHDVKRALRESQVLQGLLTVHLPSSTSGVVILENDPSIREALKNHILSLVPSPTGKPRPVRKSGTGHTEAHLQATCLSSSVSIPIKDGQLLMGPWQEVIVFDFDDKVARCEVLIHVMGEGASPPAEKGKK